MTALLAASGFAGLLPLLLFLVCPLAMIFMMKGMHGGGHGQAAEPKSRQQMTMDELKDERDELNEEIGQRAAQGDKAEPTRFGSFQ